MIYVRSSFDSYVEDAALNVESFWIKICPPNASPLFINATYHPPHDSSAPLLNYLKSSTEQIFRKHSMRDTVIICGDFNHLDLNDYEITHGITTLPSPPTRGNSTLDLILSNRPDLVANVGCVEPSLTSDHLAVFMKPLNRLPPTRNRVSFTDFCFKGFSTLNSLMEQNNFAQLYTISSLNDAAEWLESELCSIVKAAFPVRNVIMSDRDPQWMTPKAKWLITRKHRALRKSQSNKVKHLNKNIIKIKLQITKKNASKQLWNKVDLFSHRKASQKKISYESFEPQQLNKDLAARCSTDAKVLRPPPPVFDCTSHSPPELSLLETANILQSCKRTSPGPSEIPHFLFREYFDILAPLYNYIWNWSLKEKKFPVVYKRSNLIPIPKTNNATTTEQIRGISITPIAARLFEKLAHKKWITPNLVRLGDPLQFAYKPSLSTTDCLLTLQHLLLSFLDQQEFDGVHLIMLDFSKAFDRIEQEKAAIHFPDFIQSPFICQWLYSFLTDRHQRLVWQSKFLHYIPINLGCPQGTVGGPNVYNIFSDGIRATTHNSTAIKYSDDTNIIIPCPTTANLTTSYNLHEEISNIDKIAKEKSMTINEDKTSILRFCLNSHPECHCFFDTRRFKNVSSARILGIQFQSNLLFTEHCKILIRHLKRTLYVIRDLKINQMASKEIDIIFNSLIVSKVRYGLSVYGSDQKALRKLDKFFEKCCERGYSSGKFDVYELLKNEDNRILNSIRSNPCHPLIPFLNSSSRDTQHTTRHNFSHFKQPTRTKTFAASFCNRVCPF